jgi:hypothetical protein
MKRFYCQLIFIINGLLGFFNPIVSQTPYEKYLCFDYAVQYEYNQLGSYGKVLIRYNSLDKIAMYQFFVDGEWQENILRFHFNGQGDLNILLVDGSQKWTFIENNDFKPAGAIFPNAQSLQRYLQKIPHPIEVAGFEANGWEGTGPDGTYRKIYLLDDAFDARPISHLQPGGIKDLPVTLTEAMFLNDSQILMKSLVYQENQLLNSLELTWITHDFFAYPLEIEPSELPQHLPIGKNSRLFNSYPTIWQNYERMSGLTYDPRSYSFTECFTFEWRENQISKGSIQACFNPEHTICALYLPGNDYPTLVFLNGQIHQYQSTENNQITAWVHLPPADKPSMEDLEFIRLSATLFRERFKPCSCKLAVFREDKWYCQNAVQDEGEWKSQSMALRPVEYDTRALHTGIHQVLSDFPELLDMPIPPYQLLTFWKGEQQSDASVEWILIRTEQITKVFDDRQVSKFYKFY